MIVRQLEFATRDRAILARDELRRPPRPRPLPDTQGTEAGETATCDALFQSILDDPPWHGFLLALEDYIGCGDATAVLRLPRSGRPGVMVSTTGTPQSWNPFHNQDNGPNFLADLPANEVHLLRERFGEAELANLDYYARYLRGYGVHDLLCLNLLHPESGITFRLRCTRRASDPLFGEIERRKIERLIPRLHIAVSLYARIASQQLGLSVHDELEEQLDIGSIMLDDAGRMLQANGAARRLIEAGDGIAIEAGRLVCTGHSGQRNLAAALQKLRERSRTAGACTDDVEFDVQGSSDGTRTIRVLCRTLAGRAAFDGEGVPSVLVLVRPVAQREGRLSTAKLMQAFGLTRAEASLTEKLVSGHSLYESALGLGIAKATARCHLSAIFAKTGCHRQAELVGLVLNTFDGFWPE